MDNYLDNFNKKNFIATYFETVEEAKKYLLNEIKDTSVGFGGSMTIKDMNLIDELAKENKVYSHSTMGKEALADARNAEVYISSANAITKTGDIINIDALGNRVSATIYGAKRVFFICGINKLADDIQSGIHRAKNIAAPQNARRLNKKTPCAIKADKCYNCASPDRICRVTTIMSYPVMGSTVYVVIINENLGY